MKYELSDQSIEVGGRTLRRVKALRDFSDVSEGDLGGYVESLDNLSQNGDCWVSGDAHVYGDAQVYGDAWVYWDAHVWGDAYVSTGYHITDISSTPTTQSTTNTPRSTNIQSIPNQQYSLDTLIKRANLGRVALNVLAEKHSNNYILDNETDLYIKIEE